MAEWYVYVLRCADNSLYTGVATDIEGRVSKHNAGKGAKYTRTRRPVVLVYREAVPGRGAALAREAAIKRMRPLAKRRFIADSIQHKALP
jgi:predicted GIY-YIG superfamily endonuclease